MTAQFEDGKEDGALRTIGEVSRALGIKTHVLRYWEQQFPMLEPLKRSGGRRYYRTEDVALIETINRLVNEEGYTIKGAQQAIEKNKVSMADSDTETPENSSNEELDETAANRMAAPVIDPDIAPASDGGVDAFFGKSSKAVDENADDGGEAPALSADEGSDDDRMSRAEILARLKQLRANLAQATAA